MNYAVNLPAGAHLAQRADGSIAVVASNQGVDAQLGVVATPYARDAAGSRIRCSDSPIGDGFHDHTNDHTDCGDAVSRRGRPQDHVRSNNLFEPHWRRGERGDSRRRRRDHCWLHVDIQDIHRHDPSLAASAQAPAHQTTSGRVHIVCTRPELSVRQRSPSLSVCGRRGRVRLVVDAYACHLLSTAAAARPSQYCSCSNCSRSTTMASADRPVPEVAATRR